ncbi:nickel-dependent hydrogenase large subunit [Shigella flexneri]
MHFYQLAGMDWIHVLDALKADPRKTSRTCGSPPGRNHPLGHFFDVQNRLKKFVEGGQLGISQWLLGDPAEQTAARS